jgi:hypothetical protein
MLNDGKAIYRLGCFLQTPNCPLYLVQTSVQLLQGDDLRRSDADAVTNPSIGQTLQSQSCRLDSQAQKSGAF